MTEELKGLKTDKTSFEENGETFTYPEEIQILKNGIDIQKKLKGLRTIPRSEKNFHIGKSGCVYLSGRFGSDEEIIKSLILSKKIKLIDFVNSTNDKIGNTTHISHGKYTSITQKDRNLFASILHFIESINKVTNPVESNVDVTKDQAKKLLNTA